MIPVVNDRYRYIFFYAAKSGCSSLRKLYLMLHHDELEQAQRDELRLYHNLNEVCPYDEEGDYSDYFKYIITRNPYSRIVSAFLDQYVYACQDGVREMLSACSNPEPNNFMEFLQALTEITEDKRDSHFQSQSYFPFCQHTVTDRNWKYRWLGIKPEGSMVIDYHGDISGFNFHMQRIFKRVFKNDPDKLTGAMELLSKIEKRNSLFYSTDDYPDAANMSIEELDELVFAPKPQDFYLNPEVVELIDGLFHWDFLNFGYKKGEIPQKKTSKEINNVPKDFDWEMYIRLNPDLPQSEIYNERGVVRHYLEFGRYEESPRPYKL